MFFSLVWDSLSFRMEESKIQVSLHFLIGAFGSRSLLHPGMYRELDGYARFGLDILDNDGGYPFHMNTLDIMDRYSMICMSGGCRTRIY